MENLNLRSRALGIVIVTALLVWAFFASGIRLGQDLKGGTTLRFSLDIEGAKKSSAASRATCRTTTSSRKSSRSSTTASTSPV